MHTHRTYHHKWAAACVAAMLLALPAQAQTTESGFDGNIFAGTVVARDLTGLSYETGGCITSVSEPARRSGMAEAGQVLVALDAQSAELALETAKARVADLEAAVAEKQLAIDAAEANVGRRAQELALVQKEFTRNEQIFRRGLTNEATMEGVESRLMNASFAAEQAGETLASAVSAKTRAEIALRIGQLELQVQKDDIDDLVLRAPFDGVLLGFEPNVGECVSAGAAAAQIYAPEKKSFEVFIGVEKLVSPQSTGVAIGAPVRIMRINGDACGGNFTWIASEADLEHQYLKASIEVETACAPALFLNEAVEVETLPNPS